MIRRPLTRRHRRGVVVHLDGQVVELARVATEQLGVGRSAIVSIEAVSGVVILEQRHREARPSAAGFGTGVLDLNNATIRSESRGTAVARVRVVSR